ncbi:MAG: hypothetical protein ACO1PI_10305 [Bacteroidota bacterium]
MINVFVSHPTPFNKHQEGFLNLIHEELKKYDLNPTNLGKSNWSFKSPLQPIKELMGTCKAAVIIGMERHHSYIGYEKNSKEIIHKFTSTPWNHIEAGMAYQAGLPLLILKEHKIYPEGILDPLISEYFVFEFDEKKHYKLLPNEIIEGIKSWANFIRSQTS